MIVSQFLYIIEFPLLLCISRNVLVSFRALGGRLFCVCVCVCLFPKILMDEVFWRAVLKKKYSIILMDAASLQYKKQRAQDRRRHTCSLIRKLNELMSLPFVFRNDIINLG